MKPKSNGVEMIDLQDGRVALQRNGLVIRVGRSPEELRSYYDIVHPKYSGENPMRALTRAISRV